MIAFLLPNWMVVFLSIIGIGGLYCVCIALLGKIMSGEYNKLKGNKDEN